MSTYRCPQCKSPSLVEPIGEGGMGTVWLAEQSQPVQRRVALKVIKLGMDTRDTPLSNQCTGRSPGFRAQQLRRPSWNIR